MNTVSRALAIGALLLCCSFTASAATVGQQLSNPEIRDASDKPAKLPDFGTKVLAIFYGDPDVSDQNDPFADKLKAANLDKATYRGIGIANMKDTWLPDSVIRSIVRKKIEKYDSTILTDPGHMLRDAWSLGDCNEKSVVIIVDKSGKVAWIKKGALTTAEQEQAYNLILELMKQ